MNIEQKAQAFAQSFFFSFTPDEWTYDDLISYLRQSDADTVQEMADELNHDEDLAVWEPFEDMSPSWVADQIDVMVFQLEATFS